MKVLVNPTLVTYVCTCIVVPLGCNLGQILMARREMISVVWCRYPLTATVSLLVLQVMMMQVTMRDT